MKQSDIHFARFSNMESVQHSERRHPDWTEKHMKAFLKLMFSEKQKWKSCLQCQNLRSCSHEMAAGRPSICSETRLHRGWDLEDNWEYSQGHNGRNGTPWVLACSSRIIMNCSISIFESVLQTLMVIILA